MTAISISTHKCTLAVEEKNYSTNDGKDKRSKQLKCDKSNPNRHLKNHKFCITDWVVWIGPMEENLAEMSAEHTSERVTYSSERVTYST
jgi:hypothetical protein